MSRSSVAINLNRVDLEKFLPNLQSVIAFEALLRRLNELGALEETLAQINADIVSIKQDIDDIKAEVFP